MRGHFVQQKQTCSPLCRQPGMGQRHGDQHRFLFACRALRSGDPLGCVDDFKLIAMRAEQGALCGAVALAVVLERLRQTIRMIGRARGIGKGRAGERFGRHFRQPYRQCFDEPRAACH